MSATAAQHARPGVRRPWEPRGAGWSLLASRSNGATPVPFTVARLQPTQRRRVLTGQQVAQTELFIGVIDVVLGISVVGKETGHLGAGLGANHHLPDVDLIFIIIVIIIIVVIVIVGGGVAERLDLLARLDVVDLEEEETHFRRYAL
ncbi:hypothetical protein CRUP_021878 [Coryphaenoides rupestris]|nr:hypothetical protein CRUP_021878 [Coryphaenoides rupestris]